MLCPNGIVIMGFMVRLLLNITNPTPSLTIKRWVNLCSVIRGCLTRVDSSVSEHLRTQRSRFLTHCSYASEAGRTFVTLHLAIPILTKIAQFDIGTGKTWDVWCNGVQCLMMSELKKISILSLKFLIIALCLWNTKKSCKALVDTPIGIQRSFVKLKLTPPLSFKSLNPD